MPDDTDPPVTRLAAGTAAGLVAAPDVAGLVDLALQLRCAQRLGDGGFDGVELVVAGDLLRECAAVVLEDDEVADQGEKSRLLEHALDQHLELGVENRREFLAGNGAPRLEPLVACSDGADPRFETIGDDEDRVAREQHWQFHLVGLQLVVSRVDCGGFVRRVLQFDDRKRQAIDEDDDIRAARVLVLLNGELVDHKPVVRVGLVEIQNANLRSPNVAGLVAVLDRHTVDEHSLEAAVAIL